MSDQLTIKEAKDIMRPNLKKGCTCLVCGQRAQLYVRKLTSSMIQGLILIHNEFKKKEDIGHTAEWLHLENFFKPLNISSAIRADVPKLRFWGFIEPKDGPREDGNPNSGFYRITAAGSAFVSGATLARKAVKIYNNQFYGFDGPETDVFAVVKNKFDYAALMNGGG